MATAEERFGNTRKRKKNYPAEFNRAVEIQPKEENRLVKLNQMERQVAVKKQRQRIDRTPSTSAAFDRAFGKRKR